MSHMPSRCPKCGSNRVGKERIMGAQTGDWICGECGECGQLNGVPIGTILPSQKEPDTKTEE